MKKFPRGALIYLTDACNLNCSHCGIVNNENPTYMSEKCFYEVIDLLKKKRCYIVAVSGGDPILHPHLFEFIQHIRQNNMLPVLGLSGVGISDEDISKLAESGLGCIQVSLDGSNEESNRIFRGDNSYAEIVHTIRRFHKCGIRTNIAICLCKENKKELLPFLDLARNENAFQIKIQCWESCEKNSNFTELSSEERKEVRQVAENYIDKYKMFDWITLDFKYLIEEEKLGDLQEKFMVLPDGTVKTTETGKVLGNIISQKEEILKQYE